MIRTVGYAVLIVLVLLIIAPAGFPTQLSYVASDSMEPTIETNDGFVIVPAGTIESGDIVTFWSSTREEYVTHRVVGETESGYLTKGDNNPTTDQAGGSPPVSPDDVIGKVATIQGEPVLLPGYGVLVSTLAESRGAVLTGLFLLFIVVSARESGQSSRPNRSVLTVRSVLLPIFLVSLVSAIALMYVGGSAHEFTYVNVEQASSGPGTMTVGEPKTTTMVVNRTTSPLTKPVVNSENMAITNRTRNATSITVDARLPPQESTGRYTTKLQVHKYPAVLPLTVLRGLDRIHPLVAASVTSLIVFLPMYLLTVLLWDAKAPIRPSRSRMAHRFAEVFK